MSDFLMVLFFNTAFTDFINNNDMYGGQINRSICYVLRHFDIHLLFMRIISDVNCILNRPSAKIVAPYKNVRIGKATINHWDCKIQNSPNAELISPFAKTYSRTVIAASIRK